MLGRMMNDYYVFFFEDALEDVSQIGISIPNPDRHTFVKSDFYLRPWFSDQKGLIENLRWFFHHFSLMLRLNRNI